MTKNLLRENLSAPEIEKILCRHTRTPLLPSLGSEAWRRAGQNPIVFKLARPLREKAIEEYATPLPVLTDELYASFRATGIRLPFETAYSERRKRLARAAISLLLGGPADPFAGELTESIVTKLTSIFDEVSWALPAHVNWHNDDVSGKEPMQIDLLCAETANLMAEMLDLFGPLIPSALQSRIQARLNSHISENYTNRFEEFHWPKVTHNWNAVCHQGVIGAALSQLGDTALLTRMLLLARGGLRLFLSGFSPDGGCSEGVGYWSYGFGWFAFLNAQLEARTGGELSLFEGDEEVRRIARFGPRMSLSRAKLVNFSDNGAEGTLNPSLLAYLGRSLNEPECTREAAKSHRHLIQSGIDVERGKYNLFYLGRLLLNFPETIPAVDDGMATDCYLPNLAVLVAHGTDQRGHTWDFAAKAGHNDEHHNHNDCGGFLLNIDGVRLVAEIGAPEYVKDFFSPKRYEFLATRGLGHSVPVINGCEQAAGAAYASSVTAYALTPERAEFSLDATKCYPSEAGCIRFERSFRFEKQPGKLTVRETFVLSDPKSIESALIAIYPVVLEKERAVIRGDGMELVVRALAGTRLDRVEVHPYRDHSGKDAAVHRLVWKPETLSAQVSLAVELELA